jgi:hypothetical protein
MPKISQHLTKRLERGPKVSPQDHNKTLVLIHSLVGGLFTLPLIASPWIIAKNVDSYPSPRREGQIIIAVVAVCVVLFLALIFLSTAVGLYKRKAWGRKLAFVTSVLMLVWPPGAAYIWWFIHSEEGKQLYK